MPQAPFAYASRDASRDTNQHDWAANDMAPALSLAVFADRPHMCAQLREDAVAAGFAVTSAQPLAAFLNGAVQPLAEVVLVDCPQAGAAELAALARLDMRVAQAGAALIVSTTMDALDDVFGCLDQSGAQVLVDPARTDFVLALGRVRALLPQGRLRELAEADRLTLLRLTEQVGEIAAQLDKLGFGDDAESRGGKLNAPALAFAPAPPEERNLIRRPRPALPDARLVRRILRQRQQRARFFDSDLFADPAWDMLLDLTAARAELKRVSVTSLCIASCVPPTTAMRWISQMGAAGLFQRVEDHADRRRAFIELTDGAADAMARYFDALDESPVRLV